MKKCPYCAEEIQDDARICRWCQRDLSVSPPPAAPLEQQTSGKAIASLVLGIFPVIPLVGSILAVVFGHKSRGEIRRSDGRLKGGGIALAGLLLGYIGLTFFTIAIIAAIAIPNFLRARGPANHGVSPISELRIINTAEITYSLTFPKGFSGDLQSLDGNASPNTADSAGLIGGVLASGMKIGYKFTYVPGPPDQNGVINSYTVNADPVKPDSTGGNYYFTDQTGVIRQERERPADGNSSLLN